MTRTIAITDVEAAAIAFVETVARTQSKHPGWSDVENGLEYSEIQKWRRLKKAVNALQKGRSPREEG